MLQRLTQILAVVLLTSCAHIPEAIEGESYQTELTPAMITANPDRYLGRAVRWGGVIVEVVNNENETWIEVLGLPLSSNARPLSDRTEALGRFIVKTPEFLDPEVYQQGLRFTVTGNISQSIEGKVGERPYVYPTIAADNHYLWPRRTQHRHYVTPGLWFYGFHPYWRFGYPYFGYGVWSYNSHFYPYFPVYGYLSRSRIRPHHHYRSGNFAYSRDFDWSQRHRAWELRNFQYHRFPGYSNAEYRRVTNQPRMRTSPSGSQGIRRANEVQKSPSTATRSSQRRSSQRNNRSEQRRAINTTRSNDRIRPPKPSRERK